MILALGGAMVQIVEKIRKKKKIAKQKEFSILYDFADLYCLD